MTTFTPSNRFNVLVPFDPAIKGAWGTPTSTNFTLLDQAVDGLATISVGGLTTLTLTALSGAPDQARERMQSYTGTLTTTCTVTLPNVQKWGYAQNATTGGQSIVLKTTAVGGLTMTLPPDGFWYLYWSDGSGNVRSLVTGFSSTNVTGNLNVGGTITAGGAITTTGAVSGASLTSSGSSTFGGTTTFGTSLTINPDSAGNQVFTFAPNQFIQYIPGTNSLQVATTGTLVLTAPTATTVSGPLSVTGGLTVQGVAPVLNNGSTYAISITGNAATATLANGVPWSGVTGTSSATAQFATLGVINNLTVLGSISANGTTAASGIGCYVVQNSVQTSPIGWSFPISYTAGGAYVGTGFFTTSDARSKESVEDITEQQARDWIMRGRPVTFRWKDGGKRSSGFIAQEEYVNGRGDALVPLPDERKEYAESDGVVAPGYRLTRDYNHDIAFLTAALQHVLKELDRLKAERR